MKSKILKYISTAAFTVFLALNFSSCNNQDFPVDMSYYRLFSPVTFITGTVTATNAQFTFSKVINAEKYIIELSENDSLHFTSIVRTVVISADTLTLNTGTTNMYTVLVDSMKGSIRYSARIKSETNNGTIPESKYDVVTFVTKTEKIIKAVLPEEVTSSSAILHWDATGNNVTHIILISSTDGSSQTYNLTDAEKVASMKLIENLSSLTTYTAQIYNVDNKRGEITFSTN
jgi:hypothetical protein